MSVNAHGEVSKPKKVPLHLKLIVGAVAGGMHSFSNYDVICSFMSFFSFLHCSGGNILHISY